MNLNLRILFTLVALVTSNGLFAFGNKAHDIVAELTEELLYPEVAIKIKEITSGQNLAGIAYWADEIRADKEKWDHAKYWHFISIDDDESFESVSRIEHGDILEALQRFEQQLRDGKGSGEEQWQALAFYVHLVADVHQPLHIGRWEDHGGNRISVSWFGQASNLHAIWDDGLIDKEGLDAAEVSDYIQNVSIEKKSAWENTVYLDWAKESKGLRGQAYDFGHHNAGMDAPSLGEEYLSRNKDTITQRLAQSTIRLAAKLNDIFGED